MFILKDKSITFDRKLDRIVSFDERSREYPIRTLAPTRRHITHAWDCNIWLDQGREGACVGFGCAHELAATPVPVPRMNADYAKKVIYWNAQKIDQWPGGSYPGAEQFYEGTSVLAGAKVLKNKGWISGYYWAFGLNDLILGVGYSGPAVLGVAWYRNMSDTDKNGFIHASGQMDGGHSILCLGVNVEKRFFILHNSWGRSWGVNGRCKISFGDMDKLLKEDGEACFFKGRKLKPNQQ